MTLEQVRQFIAVAEEGSINKAANKIFLSQSSLSRSMQLLEGELGQNLLSRTRQGISLTPFGQHFYDHAVILCDEYQTLKDMAIPDTNIARNNLRISSHSLSFIDYIFIETYKRNADKNPSFSLIKQDLTNSVFEVKNGLADIGITMRTTEALPSAKNLIKSNGLVYHKIAEMPLVVYVGMNHPLAVKGRDAVMAETLAEYPFVSGEGIFDIREILNILGVNSLKKNSVMVTDKDTMVEFLSETNSYTFGPDPASYSDIPSTNSPSNKPIHVMKLVGSDYKFVLGYFHKKGDFLSNSCIEFLESLAALFHVPLERE